MSSPNGSENDRIKSEADVKGINMSSLCRTLARVLVNLDEGEYTGNVQQDTVFQHDALPNQASDSATREDK